MNLTFEQYRTLTEQNPRVKKEEASVLARRFNCDIDTIKEYRKRLKEEKKSTDLVWLNNTPSLEELELVGFKQEASKRIPICPDGFIVSSYKDGNAWLKRDESVETIQPIDYKALFKQAIKEVKPQGKKLNITNNGDCLLVINCTDVHLNKKYAQNPSTLQEQIDTYKEAVRFIIEEAFSSNSHTISEIMLIIGHDFLNSEATGMTTKSTPQTNIESQTVVFKEALKTLIEVIDLCSSYTKTSVELVNGNHDYFIMQSITAALEVYYNGSIEINRIETDRVYVSWNNNAFMLTHDLKKKVSDIPAIFALEAPKMFAECKNRIVLSGHFHGVASKEFQSSQESYGIIWIQCPALSGTCRWSHDNLYVGNKQQMLGLVVHEEKGIKNHIYYSK